MLSSKWKDYEYATSPTEDGKFGFMGMRHLMGCKPEKFTPQDALHDISSRWLRGVGIHDSAQEYLYAHNDEKDLILFFVNDLEYDSDDTLWVKPDLGIKMENTIDVDSREIMEVIVSRDFKVLPCHMSIYPFDLGENFSSP